jgi:hypothetical protein
VTIENLVASMSQYLETLHGALTFGIAKSKSISFRLMVSVLDLECCQCPVFELPVLGLRSMRAFVKFYASCHGRTISISPELAERR